MTLTPSFREESNSASPPLDLADQPSFEPTRRPPRDLKAIVRRKLGRALLRSHFWLVGRRRLDRVVVETVGGRSLVVLPHVFNPKLFRSGEFLADALDGTLIPLHSLVLDLGTGSGIGAIVAAEWARRVVATDINPVAARCTRINALLNHLEPLIDVREGDLFAPVGGERFDVVLFNPPYYFGEPRDDFDRAWRSNDVVNRFAAELGDHLTPGGRALIALSTDGEAPAFLRTFARRNLSTDVVTRREHLSETFTLFAVTPRA